MKDKNLILKIMTIVIVAMGSIILIHSCQKNSLPPNEQTSTTKPTQPKVMGKSGGAGAGACSCDSKYINYDCPDPCVRTTLMGGQTSATYTMTWTGCSTTDGTASQCLNGQPYFQSQVKFCYGKPNPNGTGDKCVIQMQIDTVPLCVQCDVTHQYFPFCVQLHATCTSTNNTDWVVTLDDDDPNTGPLVKYNYSIHRDDITFQICCDVPGVGGIIYTYCCSGNMVKNP